MRKYLPFILIIAFMITMLAFSSQDGPTSNGLSEYIALKIKAFLISRGDETYTLEKIHLTLRKLAHFIEYFFLTVFLIAGFRNVFKKTILALITSGIIGVAFAMVDEVYQKGHGRTSSWFDVIIDSSAVGVAILGVAIYSFLTWYSYSAYGKRKS